MEPKYKALRRWCCCLTIAIAAAQVASANIVISGDTNGVNLANALLAGGGGGLTNALVTVSAHVTNFSASSGTYVLTSPIPSTYGLTTNGIVLSTGDVADYATGANVTPSNTTIYGTAATSNQNALLGPISGSSSNFDVTEVTVTFDVLPGVSNVSMNVVFGSEEFSSLVQTDGFGIFLNGTNIALVGGHVINAAHTNMVALSGTELNGVLAPGSNALLVISSPVVPGSTSNTLTFIIGDSHDTAVDSTVYLSALGAVASTSGVNLVVTKVGQPNPVLVGSNLTYTITVTNRGSATATDVALEDDLPDGVTFLSATNSLTGACTQSNGVVTCDLGDLSSATNATATIVVTADVVGKITNTVSVSANETDSNPTNNTAHQVTTVVSNNVGQTGIDLAGELQDVALTCKTKSSHGHGHGQGQGQETTIACKVKGRLLIENIGTEDAPSSFVKYYISDDDQLDGGDTLFKQVATGKIKPGKPKRKTVSGRCNDCGDLDGKFLIAVIDSDDTVAESDDDNNVVVFGPLTSQ